MSKSQLNNSEARSFLGKEVGMTIDRPLGSLHPTHGFRYEVNYGYVPGTLAPDGEEIDAYFLGSDQPIEEATEVCIAVIHRLDDDDDELIVAPKGAIPTDQEIISATYFQEKWFIIEIIRE